MPALPTPLRVVLCGRTTSIGKPVSTHLRPEYEVIHFIQTVDAAKADLPRLLSGQHPQAPAPDSVATNDYSQPPRVVIFGRGYGPHEVEDIRRACAGRNTLPVAWVVGDPAKAPTSMPGPGYPAQVAESVKAVLDGWRAGGAGVLFMENY
ncbi:hypothetical protein BJX96DRAFT_172763 [Aspergillus floccosus]